MTFEIPKSVIDSLPYDFAEAVEAHIKAKEEHRFTGNAAPTAPELVESAIRRDQYAVSEGKPDDFVADYVIVDDTPPPPPPPTLEQRKAAAYAQSRAQEVSDIEAIMPPGKVRLMNIDANDAFAVSEDKRTADHKKALQNLAEYNARVAEIQRAAAVREAEIDDLT